MPVPARPPADLVRPPSVQSSGSGGGLGPLVNFYSKLPKGPAPTTAAGGIKGRFFNGKNASAAPVLFTILGIFGLGYTIDYQSASCFPTYLPPISRPLSLRVGCARCLLAVLHREAFADGSFLRFGCYVRAGNV